MKTATLLSAGKGLRVKNRALRLLLRSLPKDWKRRIAVNLGVPDVRWSLFQLRRFGFAPQNVLDVGAFRGEWAEACLSVFPGASILCIEPQDEPQKELKSLAARHPNVMVMQTLLSRRACERVPFCDRGSGSSMLLPPDDNFKTRAMTTVDRLIASGQCRPPELIKLDVQGYELEVLEGWTTGFDRCQVIQCEISLIPIVPGSPLLDEVVGYLAKRGFVMWDVDELIRAPSDGAVWQIDAMFCRLDSRLRTSRGWRASNGTTSQ